MTSPSAGTPLRVVTTVLRASLLRPSPPKFGANASALGAAAAAISPTHEAARKKQPQQAKRECAKCSRARANAPALTSPAAAGGGWRICLRAKSLADRSKAPTRIIQPLRGPFGAPSEQNLAPPYFLRELQRAQSTAGPPPQSSPPCPLFTFLHGTHSSLWPELLTFQLLSPPGNK